MATTTREILGKWFEQGKIERPNATHMVVTCDTFDYDDYPVYITASTPENARQQARFYDNSSSMSRLMEVYSYAVPIEEQLEARYNFRYEV